MDLDDRSDNKGSDEVMDSDDLFEQIIEVDEGESDNSNSSDKENENTVKIFKPRKAEKAKTKQFKKLDVFIKEHHVESIEKEKFNQLWSNLTAELNAIGPPTFTAEEWKTKWSQHKYNKKRKAARNKKEIPGRSSSQDQPSHFFHTLGPIVKDVASVTHETFHSEMLDKLGVIIEQQGAILEKLDKSNSILEEIAHKA